MRAEVTADNTSSRVSWQWSYQRQLDLLTVRYRPDGGSQMMYMIATTVVTTAITNVTLPNLQCSTKYTIWVYYDLSGTGHTSVSRLVSLPARGTCMHYLFKLSLIEFTVVNTVYHSMQPLRLPLMSLLRS